ncbi:LCP family protein [Rhabdothermincola salaria]|uniref:LCP family protein n=1 Tax=Rhabdothermincola salaria TaxID=2903142 RepID=UPI001E3A6CC7|nr:LCP family protein [Rhabdothermincola salaria]MCD9625086.1 LCP family protein [Rhabdothermincola salaria]
MPAVPPSGKPAFRHAREPLPRRARWSARRKVLVVLGTVVALVALAGASVFGYGWFRWNQVERKDLALAETIGAGPQNFLIVGSDNREVVTGDDPNASAFLNEPGAGHSGQRSDTIMIARVDAANSSVDLISFPRDLWIPIQPGGEEQRINTAYNNGAQALVDTIQTEFGIDINHYVEIDFSSFKGVVDAVGGVPMYFEGPMRDEHTGFYQYELGCQSLDGDQGLAFARSRHLEHQDSQGRWVEDPTGDFGRISRQQFFIRRVIDRANASFGSLDVKAVNDVVASTADNLTIDDGLGLGEIVDLARAFQGFSGDQIVTHNLPVTDRITSGGAWIAELVEVEAEPVLNVFRGLPPDAVSPGSVSLIVRNGSGAEMQATEVSGELEGLGYQAAIGADTDETNTRTVVRYAPGMERHADQVARQLASGADLEEDASLEGEDSPIVLVTGTDFTTVLDEARPATTTTTLEASGDETTTTVAAEATDEIIGVVPDAAPAGLDCR